MEQNQKQIVLPADVYDALEFSALAFGGIGAGWYRDYDETGEESGPCCIIGHASYASDKAIGCGEIASTLFAAKLDEGFNDRIVREGERISWKEYTRRANIVRGEDLS